MPKRKPKPCPYPQPVGRRCPGCRQWTHRSADPASFRQAKASGGNFKGVRREG